MESDGDPVEACGGLWRPGEACGGLFVVRWRPSGGVRKPLRLMKGYGAYWRLLEAHGSPRGGLWWPVEAYLSSDGGLVEAYGGQLRLVEAKVRLWRPNRDLWRHVERQWKPVGGLWRPMEA